MDSKSIPILLNRICKDDRVLDVGGWAQPLRRANAVIDCFPYETRGKYGHIGNGEEQFSQYNWFVWDINTRDPWPFKDKEFDFVVCSHVLEDIRDPIGVLREIQRVGKKGYIEIPTRAVESLYGVESYCYTGSQHHRWFVEFKNDELIFSHKSPAVMEKNRGIYMIYSDPVIRHFWEENISFKETPIPQSKKEADTELIQWHESYITQMPWLLKLCDQICYYSPKIVKKNLQKLCRYIWKLPKI